MGYYLIGLCFNKAFSFSFAGYEHDYCWWEVVIITRKSMISVAVVLFSRDPLGQSVVMLVILCLSLVAHSIASPFTADWADRFERYSLLSTFFLFSFGALTIRNSSLAQFASPAALFIPLWVCYLCRRMNPSKPKREMKILLVLSNLTKSLRKATSTRSSRLIVN